MPLGYQEPGVEELESWLPSDEMNHFHQMVAHRIDLDTKYAIGKEELKYLRDKSRLTKKIEVISEDLVIQLQSYIHGLQDQMIICHWEHPLNWWQALRERWFPKWWLEKYPVEMEVLYFEERQYKAVCPHLFHDSKDDHLRWVTYSKDPTEHLR